MTIENEFFQFLKLDKPIILKSMFEKIINRIEYSVHISR